MNTVTCQHFDENDDIFTQTQQLLALRQTIENISEYGSSHLLQLLSASYTFFVDWQRQAEIGSNQLDELVGLMGGLKEEVELKASQLSAMGRLSVKMIEFIMALHLKFEHMNQQHSKQIEILEDDLENMRIKNKFIENCNQQLQEEIEQTKYEMTCLFDTRQIDSQDMVSNKSYKSYKIYQLQQEINLLTKKIHQSVHELNILKENMQVANNFGHTISKPDTVSLEQWSQKQFKYANSHDCEQPELKEKTHNLFEHYSNIHKPIVNLLNPEELLSEHSQDEQNQLSLRNIVKVSSELKLTNRNKNASTMRRIASNFLTFFKDQEINSKQSNSIQMGEEEQQSKKNSGSNHSPINSKYVYLTQQDQSEDVFEKQSLAEWYFNQSESTTTPKELKITSIKGQLNQLKKQTREHTFKKVNIGVNVSEKDIQQNSGKASWFNKMKKAIFDATIGRRVYKKLKSANEGSNWLIS